MKKKKIYFFAILIFSLSAILITTGCNTSSSNPDNSDSSSSNPNAGIKPVVEFSPEGGFFKTAQDVTITASPASGIYYTLDGTTPTISSTIYSGPITLNNETVIRVLAVNGSDITRKMQAFDFDLTEDSIVTRQESPDWQDQIIYMCMIDRFANGSIENDNQEAGEPTDKSTEAGYSGGDFSGLESKISYLKNLGVTAIWITPPVKNLWKDQYSYGGYHGYWASDFTETDPHYGTLEEYRSFVETAHNNGLYVIQDIVLNHTGDFFSISGEYDGTNWSLNSGSIPTSNPQQLPWSLNDPTDLTDDELTNGFYHWTPSITDFNDKDQIFTYQMSSLDDINTDNPNVQKLLRGYFRYWIEKVDVDGYRVDTVKYIEPSFFEDFCNSTQSDNLGIREFASSLGKNDFIVFGEAWDTDEDLCASYTQDENGTPRMDSLIYFTLNFAIRNVFGKGEPTKQIEEILNKRYTVGYANPDKLVTFVDNHDMARLLNKTSSSNFKSAHAIIMTIPGIPQIYSGDEPGFLVTRSAMFNGGFQKDGVTNSTDYYTESGEYWNFMKNIIQMRKDNSVFRNGRATVFASDESGPGVLAYKIIEGTGGVDNTALFICNTSGNVKAITNTATGLTTGDTFSLLSPYEGSMPSEITIGIDGELSVIIPENSFGAYIMSSTETVTPADNSIEITSSFTENVTDTTIDVTGNVGTTTTNDILLFIDGNINDATTCTLSGTSWSGQINLNSTSSGSHVITAAIFDGTSDYIFSDSVTFNYVAPYEETNNISDPAGDDTGPAGYSYTIPTDTSFEGHHQDIHNTQIFTSGGNLKIVYTMNDVSDVWSPTTNPFDHVMLNIFLKKSDSTSSVGVIPQMNYTIPESFTWDYFISLSGWATSMYSSEGADETTNGTALSPEISCSINDTANTITIEISASCLDSPIDLSGWQIYTSTWDEDMGNPRKLTEEGDQYKFGGGDSLTDPLVMDEIAVITIP